MWVNKFMLKKFDRSKACFNFHFSSFFFFFFFFFFSFKSLFQGEHVGTSAARKILIKIYQKGTQLLSATPQLLPYILEDSAFGELNPLEIPRICFDVVHPHS